MMKRAFDVGVSALGLVASAPFWLLIALLIRLEDGGPVFFTQRRVGRAGRPFTAYKFRSMRPHHDDVPRQAAAGDPRLTRVGRLLRATAMDELPQLWNILRGDMSVVGPRPLAEVERAGGGTGAVHLRDLPGFDERHHVRPGLTGLTQVFAPRDLPPTRKFRMDLLYVRRGTLCLDIKLILLSFWITSRGRWERQGRKL